MNLFSEKDIKRLLDRHGFRFSKSMGQNFLIDPGVPEAIANGAGIDESSGVLEIGPGIGALTQALARRAKKVACVELDRRLLPVLNETLAGVDNVEVISGDILKLDIPSMVRGRFAGLRPAVCANLPYNITTPVLTALCQAGVFETITVMVQREVALRMCAAAGTPDYGAFTVFIRYYAEPEILFDVPPEAFIPRPKVTSSVITLKMRPSPPDFITDETFFFRVVRAGFAQRRKTLVNSLEAAFGRELSKDALRGAVADCGFDPAVRGEALDIGRFAALADALKKRMETRREGDGL
jgi:16S rRNA (adenine1518-N6/adenine1519-N6)-dimethyltransferase